MKFKQYLVEFGGSSNTSDATDTEMALVQEWNGETVSSQQLKSRVVNVVKDLQRLNFLRGKRAEHLGDAVYNTTYQWKTLGGQDKTPKTDIKIGNIRISMKKAGGSQLISAGKNEAKAVFLSAVQDIHSDDLFRKVQEELDKMSNSIHANGTVTQLKAKGDQSILQYNEIHAELKRFLIENTHNNAEFMRKVVLEASTGRHKFGETSPATAEYILVFSEDGTKNHFNKIDKNDYLDGMVSRTKIDVNWKSKVDRKVGGYTLYSAVRMGYESVHEQIELLNGKTCNESIITDIMKKVKMKILEYWEKAKEWISESIDNLLEFLGIGLEVNSIKINY